MPYVTDDDSKAVGRIAEIERELQEAKAELDRWLAASSTPTDAAEMTQRERGYLLRNARAGRLDYAKTRRAKLPMGSGTMESAIRRVVNLRLKGASIFWTEEHAEQMLLLRTHYKSQRWQVLENKAFAISLATAA